MKALVSASFFLFSLCHSALAQVINGDFESWSGSSPSGWTTIDGGISVSQTSQYSYSGNSSARVVVNTRSQSSTDLRQSVRVEAGQTYQFSVRVYHTEGSIRARLYVDDYLDYSSSQVIGQWQKISHTYRASRSGNIEVGLRFYDAPGFDGSETVYVDNFQPLSSDGGNSGDNNSGDNNSGDDNGDGNNGDTDNLTPYYQSAAGLTGYPLKTALYNIIKSHQSQGYSTLWTFYRDHERDYYYERDGSLLDIYSEHPNGRDANTFTNTSDQCGTYRSEGDCYNREHSFPRSWFGGSREPMNSDVHHIFASDGYVNARRGSFPYGEVGLATYTSRNGSRLGRATSGLGYNGTVFEPIDEFKGDLARAYFYMATRYQNIIANWENNSSSSNAVLNGTSNQVFESWMLRLLIQWHNADPVSQKERDRNNAAENFQGNRNPFVDYPEFVQQVWGD